LREAVKAGLEAVGTEDGILGKGDALDGPHFLGVDGLVSGDEIGFEAVDLEGIFETHDGEVGTGEAVLAGVGGGTELAGGGARTGRLLGVGSVGSEARFGEGMFGLAGHVGTFRKAAAMRWPALRGKKI
jgi:hypothetical protein